jgi:hypothetical protein
MPTTEERARHGAASVSSPLKSGINH